MSANTNWWDAQRLHSRTTVVEILNATSENIFRNCFFITSQTIHSLKSVYGQLSNISTSDQRQKFYLLEPKLWERDCKNPWHKISSPMLLNLLCFRSSSEFWTSCTKYHQHCLSSSTAKKYSHVAPTQLQGGLCAFITHRLDCCKALFCGISKKALDNQTSSMCTDMYHQHHLWQ